MYKIEKNIIMSEQMTHQKYPYKHMVVGDSFAIPFSDGESPRLIQSGVMASIRHWKVENRLEVIFTSRTLKDKEEVRIWRVE